MVYQTGEIVYFNQVVFTDRQKDKKKNRPCIVLFSELDEKNQCKIFFCPLTTSLHSFNRYPLHHFILSKPVFNNRLSFAKINNITCYYDDGKINRTGIILKKDAFTIVKKIAQQYQNNNPYFDSEETRNVLMYFDSLAKQSNTKPKIKQKK